MLLCVPSQPVLTSDRFSDENLKLERNFHFIFLLASAQEWGNLVGRSRVQDGAENECIFEMPFIYKNEHFAETGSGQT